MSKTYPNHSQMRFPTCVLPILGSKATCLWQPHIIMGWGEWFDHPRKVRTIVQTD